MVSYGCSRNSWFCDSWFGDSEDGVIIHRQFFCQKVGLGNLGRRSLPKTGEFLKLRLQLFLMNKRPNKSTERRRISRYFLCGNFHIL